MASKLVASVAYLLVVTTLAFSQDDGASNQKDELSFRLPEDLRPTHYSVRVQPLLKDDFKIKGHVKITFEALRPTNTIILHMADIITMNETVKIDLQNSTSTKPVIDILSQKYDPQREFYIATLSTELESSAYYVLSMDYQGYLNDKMKGFYRSSYEDKSGKTVYLGTTQFQATDARRAFPCMDEPGLKAVFEINIIRPENYWSLSNMPKISSTPVEDQPGWYLDTFERSVPMSTYLVAFIVSDFKQKLSEEKQAYKFGVVSRPNVIDECDYALEIGPKIMQFYEKFFEVDYPLPKLDNAAVPDFSAGGMENWGLVIYRESGLLYNKSRSDTSTKIRISTLVSHELAHQWFGNLVTPSWWTDLWLNEGFASYVEYLGMDAADPSMKYLLIMVVNDVFKAFEIDGLASSHPVSIPVKHPDEIKEIFDAISYQKGASIIRMMSNFLTEESFRKALKNYLHEFSFANAEQDDLWEHMTNQAHKDKTLPMSITVKEIMDTWTLQMGYPVLSVKLNKDGTAQLKQERFLIYENKNSTDTHDYKWWIPVSFTSDIDINFNDTKPTKWIMPTEEEKTIQKIPLNHKWVIFNLKSAFFYRVNYDPENWDALKDQLMDDHDVINEVNRAQILDDSLNLARAGLLSYDKALEILSYIKKEKEYVPIAAALRNINYMKRMFSSFEEFSYLKNFLLSLLLPEYEKLGFEDGPDDHDLIRLKRMSIAGVICELDHKACIDKAVDLYSKWMKDPNNMLVIAPNQKAIVYCTAIRKGGQAEWDFAWNQFTKTEDGAQKNLLLHGMGCSQDARILKRYLDRAIQDGQGIRKQDARQVISSVAGNDYGRLIAWKYLQKKWSDIIKYYGSVSFTLSRIVESITKYLNTEEQLKELMSFKEKQKGQFLSAARAVDQAQETVQTNVKWMLDHYTYIVQWLKDHNYQNN